MMLDFKQIVKDNNVSIKGIIQLGSHYWQEKETFLKMGVKDFVLVEPQSHAFEVTKEKSKDVDGAVLFNCAVADKDGIFKMHCDETNQGQSSSLLNAKEHLNKYPSIQFTREEEVVVTTLDSLDFDRTKYNIIVCDLQGGEMNMLKGASKTLKYIDGIYTEVNFIEMYEGCPLVEDLDAYLKPLGFERVATGENYKNQGWSDAFYLKK